MKIILNEYDLMPRFQYPGNKSLRMFKVHVRRVVMMVGEAHYFPKGHAYYKYCSLIKP